MAVEEVLRARQAEIGLRLSRSAGAVGIDTKHRARQMQELTRRVRSRMLEGGVVAEEANRSPDKIREAAWRIIEEEEAQLTHLMITPAEKAQVLEQLLLAIFGFGVIEPLLIDPEVTEIMINGPEQIFIERGQRLVRAVDGQGRPLRFAGVPELLYIIEKIVAPINRKVDESDPIVDARLPDGSRVNVVLRPVALDGPVVTIRKFPQHPFNLDGLVRFGTLSESLAELLSNMVKARCNIVVSGGTGTGKTTFLNALSMSIPRHERLVTVEDAAELKLAQAENLVRLETRAPTIEGRGAIAMRDLVRTALRMRPDRIIIGEVRGGEALDMLQAMNTGHDGSLTTAHANSAGDLLSRLETMVLMAGVDLPIPAIRRQIASAVEFVVHLSRLPTGERRVVQVSEITVLEGNEVQLHDLFTWKATASTGRGELVATGEEIRQVEKFRRYAMPVPVLGRPPVRRGRRPKVAP